MTQHLTLPIDGPFSLAAAASFGFGPRTGTPLTDGGQMRLAFVTDDLQHQAGVTIGQLPAGDLTAELGDAADPVGAERQIRRILSVDRPVTGWLAAGVQDPVLGRLQGEHPGLRPVLFHSPYEAAAWAVLSQRRQRTQATALRQRLADHCGQAFELAGGVERAFPLPQRLLDLDGFPGIESQRMERLHAVAARALAGDLDPASLAAMETDEALAHLRTIPGLGPFYAGLVLYRSSGVADALPIGEPRLMACMRHYYGLDHTPDDDEARRIAQAWRPFRTWGAALLRAAGDRSGLPELSAPARN